MAGDVWSEGPLHVGMAGHYLWPRSVRGCCTDCDVLHVHRSQRRTTSPRLKHIISDGNLTASQLLAAEEGFRLTSSRASQYICGEMKAVRYLRARPYTRPSIRYRNRHGGQRTMLSMSLLSCAPEDGYQAPRKSRRNTRRWA